MNEAMELINNGLFPIVVCGCLMFYIFKVEKELIKSINENTTKIAELIADTTKIVELIVHLKGEKDDD